MGKVLIKEGDVYNKLTIVKELCRNGDRRVNCKCVCGKTIDVYLYAVTNGGTKSCGCHKLICNKTHGKCGTTLYKVWRGIVQRCNDKNVKHYKNYGGRGITVSKERQDFQIFYNDMNSSYENHISQYGERQTSIDRINNNGNYCKDNCKRATQNEQARNKSNNKLYEYRGKKLTSIGREEQVGIPADTIRYRVKRGRSVEKALTTEIRKHPTYEYKGRELTLSERGNILNINQKTLYKRIHRNKWTIEKSFETPLNTKPNKQGQILCCQTKH